MKVNVGVIGLGNIGRLHMMNCLHVKYAEVVAVADKSKRSLEKARACGIRNVYTDFSEMIEDRNLDLDVAVISLPNFLHFPCIRKALESRLHVFVEKPMATSVQECNEIVKMLDKSGSMFLVGHYLRFYRPIETMKDAVDNGLIGDLEAITLEQVTNGPFEHPAVPRPVPEWWFDLHKIGGGAVMDIGSHLIDLFLYFAGDSTLLFSKLEHEYNLPMEDGAILVLKSLNSTTRGIIHAGWYQKAVFPKFNFRMIVHGNYGYLSSEKLAENLYLHAMKEGTKNSLRKLFRREIRPLSYSELYQSYYKEMEYFLHSIRKGSDPIKGCSAIEGLKVVKIIEEAYRAILF